MGDRCHVDILVLEKDEQLIKDRWGEPSEYSSCHKIKNWMSYDEINYAGYDDCCELAKTHKIPFYMEHSTGSNYGPGAMLSNGDGKIYAANLDINGSFYVEVQEDGTINPAALDVIREFIKERKKLFEMFNSQNQ